MNRWTQVPLLLPIRLAVLGVLFTTAPIAAQSDNWRTLEIETTEVTGADVTVSPDGTQLVFTLLGHLFAVPVQGGDAEQLTFGPFQHRDPVFSPEGSRLAFVSNRDGSDGNIFVLDLATGSITQLTHEQEAARPTFSPDGGSIAYISLLARGHHCPVGLSALRRVALTGGDAETIPVPQEVIRSVFYLPSGSIGWAVHVRGTENDHSNDQTHVRTWVGGDSVRTVGTIQAITDRTIPHPGGGGFFVRAREGTWVPEFLSFVGLQDHGKTDITSLSPQSCLYGSGGFAITPDAGTVYVGDVGRLWKVSLTDKTRIPIPFRARVQLEVWNPPPESALSVPPPSPFVSARSIQTPLLSPDGLSLVFGAAGYLWHQDLETKQVRRLLDDATYQRDPALSPDGERLLFVWSDGWREEVRVLNLQTERVDVLAGGSTYWHPAWSPDGQRVVYATAGPDADPHLVIADLTDRTHTALEVPGLDNWSAHPQFSLDGRSLYFAAAPTGLSAIYGVSINDPVNPIRVTPLDVGHAHRPVVSPDGQWLAFRHNSEIWLARLEGDRIVDGSSRRLTQEGGEGFAFTPDGDAIVYSIGDRVWRHPIGTDVPVEVSVKLDFARPVSPPMLIERVRVLDFTTSDFSRETSVYVENGRIQSIGHATMQELSDDVIRVDAGGRFAIPGLFEMHGHIQRTFNGAWLAYGVTSLRDVGGPLGWVAALADRSDGLAADLPRLFFSGDILHGISSTRDPIMIADADEARRYVHQWKQRGVHLIKTHPGLTWATQQALMDEAHQLGLPVVEHAYPLDYLLQSVTVGGTFLEHTYGGFRYQDDVLQLLAATGTRWTPTLALTTGPAVAVIEDPDHWVDEKLQLFAKATEIREMLRYGMSDDPRVLQGFWRAARMEVRSGWKRGIKYHAGTDAPAWMVIPGASLHQELAAFADAGLPTLSVLRMATLDAAAAVGVENWLGSLEVGKIADIVLLDANPLEDVRNTRTIWRVIKDGRIIDPADLQRRN